MKKNFYDKLYSVLEKINDRVMNAFMFIGMLWIPGIIIYLVMDTFRGRYTDGGSTVFNLIGGIALTISFLIKVLGENLGNYYGIEKKKKIFPIIFIVILISSFIIGLIRPVSSLFFDYEYKGIYSGLAALTWPSIIYFTIYNLIVAKDKKYEMSTIFWEVVFVFGTVFFLSGLFAFYFSVTDRENIFDNVVEYKNSIYIEESEDNIKKEESNSIIVE